MNGKSSCSVINRKLLWSVVAVIVIAGGFAVWNGSRKSDDDPGLPMEVNKERAEIIMPAEVNAKYFTEPTRHGVVYAKGSNGEKSVLRGLSNEKFFYEALIELGAKAGDNVTDEDMKAGPDDGKSVAGDKLDVFVTWEGLNSEVPFHDIIVATEDRPMDIRFGGNIEAAKKYNTGCVLCLDSCAVGITSNAAYPTGTTQNNVVQFRGNKDLLPPDGTRVNVIFRLVK